MFISKICVFISFFCSILQFSYSSNLPENKKEKCQCEHFKNKKHQIKGTVFNNLTVNLDESFIGSYYIIHQNQSTEHSCTVILINENQFLVRADW